MPHIAGTLASISVVSPDGSVQVFSSSVLAPDGRLDTSFLKWVMIPGVGRLYYDPRNTEWRFSFVRLTYKFSRKLLKAGAFYQTENSKENRMIASAMTYKLSKLGFKEPFLCEVFTADSMRLGQLYIHPPPDLP